MPWLCFCIGSYFLKSGEPGICTPYGPNEVLTNAAEIEQIVLPEYVGPLLIVEE